MQTLNVKCSDGSTRVVTVHRSWQDISGRHIFLHHNGVYGYKDGTPVRNVSELEGLPLEHKRLAQAWWERAGQSMSDELYGRKEEEAARKAGDFQEELAAHEYNTQLDSVLYSRKAIVKGKPKGAVTAPKSWMEFGFTRRPDWWGQAQAINFSDFSYFMLNMEEGQKEEKEQEKEKEPVGGKDPGLGSETQAPAGDLKTSVKAYPGLIPVPNPPGAPSENDETNPDAPRVPLRGTGNPSDPGKPGNPEEF
ncbi:MAG: hypothetical protein A4E74_01542 [Syntrophus sp. PtaB.Bin075]|nr:MAG: hypothetical protein A4E74_01542 [Syntrophus sp. PtaB.Bin075]